MAPIESLRDALRAAPDSLPLRLLLAEACIEDLDFAEARRQFERVLETVPDHAEARLGVCRTLQLLGRYSEAILRVQHLLSDLPRFGPAWALLARLHLVEGDRRSARACYAHALEWSFGLRDLPFEREAEAGPDAEEPGDDGARERATPVERGSARVIPGSGPRPCFADVGGLEHVKETLRRRVIYPLQYRELFRAYGRKSGGAVLLYGPPGCGKTFVTDALAGEVTGTFFRVPIHDILDPAEGSPEKNLHDLFELARAEAPSVLFFDEVDALATDRDEAQAGGRRACVNQFLVEMETGSERNEGVVVIGATNAPWALDPAFCRPGRFDEILFVPPPDEPARLCILKRLGAEKPVDRVDLALLAKRTRGFSGADLQALVDDATDRVLGRALRDGRVLAVTTSDLLKSLQGRAPSIQPWLQAVRARYRRGERDRFTKEAHVGHGWRG